MCGRLDQNDIPRLIGDFSWATELYNRSMAAGSFNVPPGTYRPVMRVDDDRLVVEDLFWGYRSVFAERKKIPLASNTKLEKIMGSYWKPLLNRGRVIVPAHGWYEWTGEKPPKQPHHIHRKDRSPLYMAGLAGVGPPAEHKGGNGFTIVTADAVGGMVDVHDRRPIVFTAEDAKLWLDPALAPEQAEQLARQVALGPEAFEWYMVDRSVGNVANQGAHLATPLAKLL